MAIKPISALMSYETEVDRGWYRIILSHKDGAVTHRSPLPMLADHDYDRVIGQVFDAKVKTKKNTGSIVLDENLENPKERDVVRQMQPNDDGVVFRKNLSVGIKPDYETLEIKREHNKSPLIIVNNWEQLELSSVSQPAIPGAKTNSFHMNDEDLKALGEFALGATTLHFDGEELDAVVKKLFFQEESENKTEDDAEEAQTDAVEGAGDSTENSEDSEEETTEDDGERTEESEEETSEETSNVDDSEETSEDTETQNSTGEGNSMPEELLTLGAKLDSVVPGAGALAIQMAQGDKDTKIDAYLDKLATINVNKAGRTDSADKGHFNLGAFITGVGHNRFNDIEHELSRAKEARSGMEDLLAGDNEYIIPFEAFDIPNNVEKFTVAVGSTGASNFIPTVTETAGFIPALVDRARILAFCDVKSGLISDYEIPRFTSVPNPAEINDGAPAVPTDPGLSGVKIQPRPMQVATDLGQLVLHQTQQRIARDYQINMLENFAARMTYHILVGGLTGAPASTAILSLAASNTGANKIVAADLAGVTYPKLVQMETDINRDKAPERNRLYVLSPEIVGKGKTTAQDTSNLWIPWIANGLLNESPYIMTTHLTAPGAIFGSFMEILVGIWGNGIGVRRTVTDDGNDRLFFRVWWGWAVKHATSFAYFKTS